MATDPYVRARAIEKHFTLSHDYGILRDHKLAATPKEFKEMVEGARRIERGFGVYGKFLFDEEMAPRNKHTKSIVSACAIPKGAILTAEMLVCKSPGYGLKPRQLSSLFGKRAARNIEEDTVLTEDDILWN